MSKIKHSRFDDFERSAKDLARLRFRSSMDSELDFDRMSDMAELSYSVGVLALAKGSYSSRGRLEALSIRAMAQADDDLTSLADHYPPIIVDELPTQSILDDRIEI